MYNFFIIIIIIIIFILLLLFSSNSNNNTQHNLKRRSEGLLHYGSVAYVRITSTSRNNQARKVKKAIALFLKQRRSYSRSADEAVFRVLSVF